MPGGALYVHRDKKLLASVTDGDIRRFLLNFKDIDAPIIDAAYRDVKYIELGQECNAFKLMKKYQVNSMPVLDNGRIVDVVCKDGSYRSKISRVALPVVIMAGGKGTRLYPYTKILPKALIPVGELPIAEHIIEQFKKYACKDFYFILNHKKNMIKAYFNEIDRDYNLCYIDEDKPLGTGGGLALLKGKINSSFILSNCDILIQTDLSAVYHFHKKNKNIITMICSLKQFQIPYGIVETDEEGQILSLQEKPEMSFFTNTGCYFVEPRVVDEMEENIEIGFPQIVERYKAAGENVGVYPIPEDAWLDMGQMDELEKMKQVIDI